MLLTILEEIRSSGSPGRTVGLPDDVIERFSATHPALRQAMDEALQQVRELRESHSELLELDEPEQIAALQGGLLNLYEAGSINPYVPLAARGPWIVTSKGAVLHDSGGYGMLGLGHGPAAILATMARPAVMANVMTASFSQARFAEALRREIGRSNGDGCPFDRFVCINSGSEAMTLAARLSDVNAKEHTDAGGRHAGRAVKVIALRGGFHGRTDRPAGFSDSTRDAYMKHLASFRGRDDLLTVAPNDVDQLRRAFARAERERLFIESVLLEPVMGEGNPGLAIEREFYDAARELTADHGSLLVVDSIQAGLRAHGVLSIIDYPGFEDALPPDVEAYSKALNAGQYPLSVLALSERSAELYRHGVYGNTMTTNPRGLDVACAVLESITPEVRDNIEARGRELVQKLQALAGELDGGIVGVQGTGLLVSAELAPDLRCHGFGSVEERMRLHGLGVIHGGASSLRYTPHFAVDSDEIDLIVAGTGEAIRAVR
ncbi:MAG: aminotransferase class III-fold pyridoxal phosphate-dependent enzyme [bacterium]|nr:aminotransferase class III-fold pyridoxal phosphate-dependent enzyme [bacterium]